MSKFRVGQLPTMNDDHYFKDDPDCAWWVQIWVTHEPPRMGSCVVGRIYGPTPDAARERAAAFVKAANEATT